MTEEDVKYLLYIMPTLLVIFGFGLFLLLKKEDKKKT